MDKDFFEHYGTSVQSYDKVWQDFTMKPYDIITFLDILKFKFESVFNIGAADGRWLKAFKKLAPNSEYSGIEIYKDIIKTDNVEHCDLRDYNFDTHFDLVYFNSIAYLSIEDVKLLLSKLDCDFFITGCELWDTLTSRSKYEVTFQTSSQWVKLFYDCGWEPVLYAGFWFLKRSKKVLITPIFRNVKYHTIDRNTIKFGKTTITKSGDGLDITIDKGYSLTQLLAMQLGFFINSTFYSQATIRGKHYKFYNGWYNQPNGELSYEYQPY